MGALAYVTSSGAGGATASVGTIDGPANVLATAANGSTSGGASPVTITWNAPSANARPTAYRVVRDDGSSSETVSCSESPCTDAGVPAGAHVYHVQSLLGTSWTSGAADSNTLLVVGDDVPPDTTVGFPAPGGSYTAAAFARPCAGICGTAADPSGVTSVRVAIENSMLEYWDGNAFTSSTPVFNPASGTESWSYAFTPPADGVYTVRVQATDGSGDTTSAGLETIASFTFDTVAPAVSLTQLPATTNADVRTIGGGCGTAVGDSATVIWSITGGTTESGTAACSSGAWTATLTSALSTEARYAVSATQVDAAGNTGSTGDESISIDKTAPIVAVTQVNGSAQSFPLDTNATVTSIGGTCGTEPGDGAAVSWSFATQSGTATCSSGAWTSGAFETGVSAEGADSAQVSQPDAAGNTGGDSRSVLIDKSKPVITADGGGYTAGTWTNQNVTVSFSCADAGAAESGLVTNTVGGGGTQSDETSSGTFTSSGSCTDAAGNTADSLTFGPIRIDKTKPLIGATTENADGSAYTPGTWTNQAVNVTFRCADAGSVQSGIAADTLTGGSIGSDTATATVTDGGNCLDRAGNGADPVTVGPIMVDTTKPTGSITAPLTGATITGGSAIVSSDSTDPAADGVASGIQSVRFEFSAHGGSSWTTIGGATWNTAPLANGSYDLRVVTTDKAGNSTTTGGVTVVVDNTYSFAVGPIDTRSAGTPFGGFALQLQENGSNSGTLEGAAYAGGHVITFGGPATADSPSGAAATGLGQLLTFDAGGRASVPAGSVTLVKAQAAAAGDFTATDTADDVSGATTVAIDSAGVTLGLDPSGVVTLDKNRTKTFTVIVPADAYGNPFTSAAGLSVGLKLSAIDHMSLASASITVSSGPAGNTFGVTESGNDKGNPVTLTVVVSAPFAAPAPATLSESG